LQGKEPTRRPPPEPSDPRESPVSSPVNPDVAWTQAFGPVTQRAAGAAPHAAGIAAEIMRQAWRAPRAGLVPTPARRTCPPRLCNKCGDRHAVFPPGSTRGTQRWPGAEPGCGRTPGSFPKAAPRMDAAPLQGPADSLPPNALCLTSDSLTHPSIHPSISTPLPAPEPLAATPARIFPQLASAFGLLVPMF